MPTAAQNWLIVPATPLLPADKIADQEWLLIMTAISDITFKGNLNVDGANPGIALEFFIELEIEAPLQFAFDTYQIPYEPFSLSHKPFFCLDPGSAPFVTVSGAFDLVPDIPHLLPGSGYAVQSFATSVQDTPGSDGTIAHNAFLGVGAQIFALNVLHVTQLCCKCVARGRVVYLKIL
jgi:hypothetical protein